MTAVEQNCFPRFCSPALTKHLGAILIPFMSKSGQKNILFVKLYPTVLTIINGNKIYTHSRVLLRLSATKQISFVHDKYL